MPSNKSKPNKRKLAWLEEQKANLKELDEILTEMESPFALFDFSGTRTRQIRLEILKSKLNNSKGDI